MRIESSKKDCVLCSHYDMKWKAIKAPFQHRVPWFRVDKDICNAIRNTLCTSSRKVRKAASLSLVSCLVLLQN
jgi:hypothetical protein